MNSQVEPYIPPTSRLFWAAHNYRIGQEFADRWELECVDGFDNPRTLPKSKAAELLGCGDIIVDPFYFDIDGKPAKQGSQSGLLAGKPLADIRQAMITYTIASMFHLAYERGETKLYATPKKRPSNPRRRLSSAVTADVWLKNNAAVIHQACMPYYVLDPKAPRVHEKPRFGQQGYPALPSVSKLKKDRAKLNAKGFKITDFCPDHDAQRAGGLRLPDDMREFVLRQIREVFLRPERMTYTGFRRYLAAELRADAVMAERSAPAVETIRALVEELPDAAVIAARFGAKVSIHKGKIFTKGHTYTYPGELVLMDGWKADLVAKLNEETGGWLFEYDPHGKEPGPRLRVWVVWVIDAFSTAILGIAIGLSESASLAVQALRMAVSDKKLHCLDAGCTGEPIPAIGFDGVLTDVGSSFKSPMFQVPAFSLVANTKIGPGEKAHLRGLIERNNRTVKDDLLPFFTGTTFGNVVTKGDYDSVGRASVNIQKLGRALWLYCNDVRNRRESRGLGGQSPIDRFNDIYNLEGAPDGYTEETLRIAFGLSFDLPLTRQGICYAGNRYYSGRLQKYFSDVGYNRGRPRLLRAKIDTTNLGRISVFVEGEWHTLAGPISMKGVGLTDWLRTIKELKKRYGEQAKLQAPIVERALLKLNQMGTEARLRSQVADMSYNNTEAAGLSNSIRLDLVERETPTVLGRVLSFSSATAEAAFPVAGSAHETPPDAQPSPDPYAGALSVRDETDVGLDEADIDQDGDPLEIRDEEANAAPERTRTKPRPKPPAADPVFFLPQPSVRK